MTDSAVYQTTPIALKPYTVRNVVSGTPRERLLQAACDLFCRFGINAVGVDAIVEAAGTAKTTLYKLFGSKDGLVTAVLEEEGLAWRSWFLARLDEGEVAASERLRRIFPVLGEWFAEERFFGCPFINAVGEHDKADDRIRNLALTHKKAVLQRISALAEAAGANDPHALMHETAILIDGAIVAAMITRDPDISRIAAGALNLILAARLPKPHAFEAVNPPVFTG